MESNLLLSHVLDEGVCTDGDCELHNLDVAMSEEVVGPTEVAYFLAGYQQAIKDIDAYMEQAHAELLAMTRRKGEYFQHWHH